MTIESNNIVVIGLAEVATHCAAQLLYPFLSFIRKNQRSSTDGILKDDSKRCYSILTTLNPARFLTSDAAKLKEEEDSILTFCVMLCFFDNM